MRRQKILGCQLFLISLFLSLLVFEAAELHGEAATIVTEQDEVILSPEEIVEQEESSGDNNTWKSPVQSEADWKTKESEQLEDNMQSKESGKAHKSGQSKTVEQKEADEATELSQKEKKTQDIEDEAQKDGAEESEQKDEREVQTKSERKTISQNQLIGVLVSETSVSQNSVSQNQIKTNQIHKNQEKFNQISENQINQFQTKNNPNSQLQEDINVKETEGVLKSTDDAEFEQEWQENVDSYGQDKVFLVVGFLVIFGGVTGGWFFLFQFQGGKVMKNVTKKRMEKAFGLFLAVTLLWESIPMRIQATESISANAVVSENTVNEEATQEPVKDIFTFDWKNATNDEINDMMGCSGYEEIGVWLKSLSDAEFNEVIARDTVLNKEICLAEYTADEDGNMTVVEGTQETDILYKYAMSQVSDEVKALYFTNKSGYYYLEFLVGSTSQLKLQMKVSNVDTSTPIGTQQTKLKFAVSHVSGSNASWLSYRQNAGGYGECSNPKTEGFSTQKNLEGTSESYYTLRVGGGFYKPVGYTATVNYINKTAGVGDLYYYMDGDYATYKTQYSDSNASTNNYASVITCINLMSNTTIGGTNYTPNAETIQVIFTPITYTMSYLGNGANGGSTPSQTCAYGNTYYTPANGYTRAYTVTYNGNGGTSGVASNTANYVFTGWKWGSSVYGANQAYSNMVSTKDIDGNYTGTMYAVWEPRSVTLPSATRTGYTFTGWSGAGNAGAAYTPTANTTLTATWSANKYTVKFDSNGGSGCSNVSATYDQNVNLPTPTRAGYTFTGWSGAGGTYKGTAKNLTAANNATVTLTAQWSANTNTKYTINRYVQKELDSTEYVLFEGNEDVKGTETMTGTTDTTVTVPAVELAGYDTPDAQMVKINGNGSSVVNFYYNITDTRAKMTVNHYIQMTPGGEYVLFTGRDAEGNVIEGFEDFESEYVNYNGTVGDIETPEVYSNLNEFADIILGGGFHFELPQPQTVTLSKNTEVNYYYTTVENSSVEYVVQHYIKKSQDGKYELYKEERKWGEAGIVVTPSLNADAIKAVNAVSGCVCKEPSTQTVTIAKNLTVKYYYDCVSKEVAGNSGSGSTAGNGTGAGTGTGAGLTDEDINEIAKKLAAGLSFSMDVDGVTYEIAQNPDGTLGIKFITNSQNTERIVIPDVVQIGDKVYRITEIYENAFKDNTTLKEVVISQNISKIGNSAFEGCTSLRKVTLQEGLVTIGNKAFKNCTSLTSLKTPSTLQTIGNSAFENCTALKTVTLNNGLVKIGNKAFFKCISLKKIKIPKTVLKIGSYAFAQCKKLKTVTFAYESQLLSMGKGIFSNCVVLKKIKLPAKLTNIPAKAFYNCKKLSSVTIGASVTKIGTSAFNHCSKITKVTITSKVQTIGKKAFYNCKKLRKVSIKSKALTAVGTKAFKNCSKKLTISVPKSKRTAYIKLLKGKL